MNSRSTPFVVGIFVISSVALVVALTLFFGGSEYFEPKVRAETVVTDSVSGLTVGSPVKFRGVPVGQVQSIGFVHSPEHVGALDGSIFTAPVRIVMELRRDTFDVSSQGEFDTEVASGAKRGLRARLTPAGLTGGLVVELSMMEPAAAPLPKLPAGFAPQYAYVPSTPGLITEFVDRLTQIMHQLAEVNIKELTDHLNTLLENGNRVLTDRIGPAIDEAKVALDEIRVLLADKRIESIIGNVDQFTGSLANAMGGDSAMNLKDFIATLPKLSQRVREVVDRLDALVSNPRITEAVDSLGKELGPTLASIRQAADRIDDLITNEQYDIHELIDGLRTLVDNLDQLSSELKTDPARLIFSKPPPPFEPKPVSEGR